MTVSSPYSQGQEVQRLEPGLLPLPSRAEDLFARLGPLVVEAGFGNGGFLVELAREHPDWNLIGVEIAPASVTRAYLRLRREKIPHVRLLRGHARFLLRELLQPRSVHRVYVNFPDPWPKERHQPRRLLQAPFFRLLSTRLEPKGALLLTTDDRDYFDSACDHATATRLFRVEIRPAPEAALRTKYAAKWQAVRKSIQHAVFHKTGEDANEHPRKLEVIEMAHALLEGDLSRIEAFERTVHHFQGGTVILLAASRSLDHRRITFEAFVDEHDLRQEILVQARPSAQGVYVELKHFGAPVLSRGVREAVHAVAAWLENQGMRPIQEGK